jgi:hypothetical protein
MRGYQESQPFLPLFVQVPRRREDSRNLVKGNVEEIVHLRDASGNVLELHTRAYIERRDAGYHLRR